jgi:hypothetical protein
MRSDAERSVKFSVAVIFHLLITTNILFYFSLNLSFTTVFMDFERAAQNAIRSVCHGITIKGWLSMSWNYHHRLLFPLYTVYMAQSTDARFTNLGYDVVCKWRCVYWEVGVIQILQTVKPCVLYLVFRNKWQCSCTSNQFSDVLVVPVWNL